MRETTLCNLLHKFYGKSSGTLSRIFVIKNLKYLPIYLPTLTTLVPLVLFVPLVPLVAFVPLVPFILFVAFVPLVPFVAFVLLVPFVPLVPFVQFI